jgi:dihydrofolate reductase
MRKLITAMKISLDGKFEGPQGYADWVAAWSDDYGLTPQIDACVLGAGMYPGYEQYWTPIQDEPGKVHPLSGAVPTPAEVEWAEFARRTPHYVLSSTLTAATWPQTQFLRGFDDLGKLKLEPGRDIYLVGGGTVTAAAIDAGLVDEIRLLVYPVIAGGEHALFKPTAISRGLELRTAERRPDGRLSLVYGIDGD